MNEITVLIGMHSYGTIHIETTFCLLNAVANIPYRKKFVTEKHAYPPYGKNKIIQKAIDENFTYLVIIDGDMVFEKDSITRLMAHDLDLVGANYNKRKPGNHPIVRMQDENGKLYVPEKLPEENLFEVFSVGGGFFCAKVDMLRKMQQPYFDMPIINGELLGDDVFFCKQVHDAGYKIWCDKTISLYHIGDFPY